MTTPNAPLPMTRAEITALGWDRPDVVLVSGDAYVDHPSFACALIGRTLQRAGFRVAILPQPDWRSAEPFLALGVPRLFWGVSAGNMDSMINHYTANRLPRSDDAYTPGGKAGSRPDRATNVYAQRCREAAPGVPVVAGGVEASLRRLAHFDYWSETVRPSVLLSSKADLVVFGMGERAVVEIAQRLAAGERIERLRDIRGTAYLLGAQEALPEFAPRMLSTGTADPRMKPGPAADGPDAATVRLPSLEEVTADKLAFSIATRLIHRESNPFNARRLVQAHGGRLVVQNPPAMPLSEAEMDAAYDAPYTRRAHPAYRAEVPAERMIKDSVTILRGCFAGCSFCSITTHQGRVISSRSPASVEREVDAMARQPDWKGHVSDLGGPTANMYRMRCTSPDTEAQCRRLSCIHPSICRHLGTDHGPLIDLMRAVRGRKGVKRVFIASGVRMDLAARSPEYLRELAQHHVSGHLKVAPEHVSERVLAAMKKPPQRSFEEFAEGFRAASQAVGKEQYLVPYFIASHPGCDLSDMIELALFLKGAGYRPQQVQDFIPAPMDLATSAWYTGLDPHTLQPLPVQRKLTERRMQRALMQFFKPENWFLVKEALEQAGRTDLIGDGPQCLIRSQPPAEALGSRARRRGAELGSYVHQRGLLDPRRKPPGSARRPGRPRRGGPAT